MSTKVPVKVLPPETPIPHGEEPQLLLRPRFSRRRLALAFIMVALADGLSVFLTFTPPVEWAADLVTGIFLFIVLGWQWILLFLVIVPVIIYLFSVKELMPAILWTIPLLLISLSEG